MKYTRQDYSLINSYLLKYQQDLKLESTKDAFYYLIFDLFFNLQSEEAETCITDSHFLNTYSSNNAGHDRGIDAVYIEENKNNHTVHLFNFKHFGSFEKSCHNFPSGEIDKVLSFINHLFKRDDGSLKSSINPMLHEKVTEIYEILDSCNPDFVLHIVGNCSQGLEKLEQERLVTELKEYRSFRVNYLLAPQIVERVTKKDKKEVNARVIVSKKEIFEQSGGDIKALIVNLNVRDCIRIVLDNEEIRLKANPENYEELTRYQILEDAFEDNVRVYLKQTTRINQNIKRTLLSEEAPRFFYYNNGITITCHEFVYNPGQNYPLIELKNIQVVNGSQTIHALYDALLYNYEKLENAYLLCRIYQIKSPELSGRIAQFTNSQNPVNSRDIKSIDYVQIKLENEFKLKGMFYERKKNQYENEPKNLRLDAEKVGQILMSFYNGMPYEAKNDKASIFGEKYEEVFNESIDADKVILALNLFEYVDQIKSDRRNEIFSSDRLYDQFSYLIYASFYILDILRDLAINKGIHLMPENFEAIKNLYSEAIKYIEEIIEKGRKDTKVGSRSFTYSTFFKSPNPTLIYREIKNNHKPRMEQIKLPFY
jgi:hypothetical protein